MAKKTQTRDVPLTFKPGRRRKSLIEWKDPARQAQVLDWRHRAQEFGVSIEPHTDADEDTHHFPIEA
jgi:hypothetical protein